MSSSHCFCLLIGGWRATSLKPLHAIVLEELKAIDAAISEIEVDAAVLKSTLFFRIVSLRDGSWEVNHLYFIKGIAKRIVLELKLPVWMGESSGYDRPWFSKCDADGDSASELTEAAMLTELGWGPKNIEGGLQLRGGKRVSITFEVPPPDRATNVRNAMKRKPIGPMVEGWLAAARKAQAVAGPKGNRKPLENPRRAFFEFVMRASEPGRASPEQKAIDDLFSATQGLVRWCHMLGQELAAAASAARIAHHFSDGSRLDVLMEWVDEPEDLEAGLSLFEEDRRGEQLQKGLEALASPGPKASRVERENYELELQRLANLLFGCSAFAQAVLQDLNPGASLNEI